jgi:hypothetical protein
MTWSDSQGCKRPNHPNKSSVGALLIHTPRTFGSVECHGSFQKSDGEILILTSGCCISGGPELVAFEDISVESVIEAIGVIVCRVGLGC